MHWPKNTGEAVLGFDFGNLCNQVHWKLKHKRALRKEKKTSDLPT